ncbi:hypothetical protein JHK87_024617 [Glycine soja]|nr:hypothetical protein JHK87_024617 [Glycine soja]
MESMSEEEKREFDFDVKSIDWNDYITNVHIPGLRRHVMKGRGMGSRNVSLILSLHTVLPTTPFSRSWESGVVVTSRDESWPPQRNLGYGTWNAVGDTYSSYREILQQGSCKMYSTWVSKNLGIPIKPTMGKCVFYTNYAFVERQIKHR